MRQAILLTKEQELAIVEDYNNGIYIKHLCKKYKLGRLKIIKVLNDNKIEIKRKGYLRKN